MIAHSPKLLLFLPQNVNMVHAILHYIQQKKRKYNRNIKKSIQKFITGQARRETIAKR